METTQLYTGINQISPFEQKHHTALAEFKKNPTKSKGTEELQNAPVTPFFLHLKHLFLSDL